MLFSVFAHTCMFTTCRLSLVYYVVYLFTYMLTMLLFTPGARFVPEGESRAD